MKKIKVKYFVNGLEPVQKIKQGDWIDLRAATDISIEAGKFCYIPLGVAMQLPKGYEAHIAPRSSTFRKWGIIQTNSIGIVDESYCGDNDQWQMPVYTTKNVSIEKNDRICQFRIVKKQPRIKFLTVKALNNKDRGGLGSTGSK